MQLLRAVGVWWLASQCLGFNVLAVAAESAPNTSPYKERRLALVIGNSAYEAAPLRNPVNDARDLAAALADSGFEVTRLENASLRELRTALRDFGDRLKKQGGVGLFYFAGHGMQVKGRNYLIPVAAQIEREDEVEFESLDANLVLEKLDSAGNRFNIVILDACRNNPFARSFRSSTQGLAQMDAPSGAVVAFATSPGSVASDGGGRNGLYSQHLIESVRRPGLKIEEVFKQVRAAVRRDSNGMQTPWESTSLEGDFYFHPVDVAAAETARKQQEQARLEEAIRIAVAQERERIRKEFAAAEGQAGGTQVAVAAIDKQTAPPVAPAAASPASPPSTPAVADTAAKTLSAGPGTVANAVTTSPKPKEDGSAARIQNMHDANTATIEAMLPVPQYPLDLAPALARPDEKAAEPAPTAVASDAPKLTHSPGTTNTTISTGATLASGNVIGSRLEGKIPPPEIAAGDEWELLSITSTPSNPASEPVSTIERIAVVGVDPGGQMQLFRERLDKPGGAPAGGARTYFVNSQLATLFDSATVLGGQRKLLLFPLETRTSWSYSYDYPLGQGSGRGHDDFDCKVVGWEQVTVPAGTFWALKIEQRGWRNNLSSDVPSWSRKATRLDFTFWYSPEVKYIVKSVHQRYNPGLWGGTNLDAVVTDQLIRFTSAAAKASGTTAATK